MTIKARREKLIQYVLIRVVTVRVDFDRANTAQQVEIDTSYAIFPVCRMYKTSIHTGEYCRLVTSSVEPAQKSAQLMSRLNILPLC